MNQQLNPKTEEEARESRKYPRMARTSNRRSRPDYFRGNFSHLPLLIRVHWLDSRAKSGSGFNPNTVHLSIFRCFSHGERRLVGPRDLRMG
jgi:hypothetical protein